MIGSPRIVPHLAALALWLTSAGLASFWIQEPDHVAEFDRLQVEFEVAGDERAEVGRAALEAFLRIPLEDAARRPRLIQAARLARESERRDWGLALAEQAFESGLVESPVVEEILIATLELGRSESALRRAFAWREVYPATVTQFVLQARFIDSGSLFLAAGSLLRRGQTEVGLFAFEQAATSGSALDLANLALTHRNLGEFDEAIALYERAVGLAPDDAILWSDFGLCLRVAGRGAEALDALERSVQVEVAAGMGPATTNLLLMRRFRMTDRFGDPRDLARRVLGPRPQQELVRRMQIELALGRF